MPYVYKGTVYVNDEVKSPEELDKSKKDFADLMLLFKHRTIIPERAKKAHPKKRAAVQADLPQVSDDRKRRCRFYKLGCTEIGLVRRSFPVGELPTRRGKDTYHICSHSTDPSSQTDCQHLKAPSKCIYFRKKDEVVSS